MSYIVGIRTASGRSNKIKLAEHNKELNVSTETVHGVFELEFSFTNHPFVRTLDGGLFADFLPLKEEAMSSSLLSFYSKKGVYKCTTKLLTTGYANSIYDLL